jgi:disulfide bond formation protein DsbB
MTSLHRATPDPLRARRRRKPIVTLKSVANEAFELFFALLALLALGGSVAVVAFRILGGAPGRSVLAGIAPLQLAVPALVTSVSMLGSLYFSEAVNYRPCVLCWYQRIAMYALAIILVIAAVRKDRSIRPYATALASIGGTISAYHWLLERWPQLDTGSCSADAPCSVPYFEVFGFVSLAFMALCAFVTVLVFLWVVSPPSAVTLESDLTPKSTKELT